MIYITIATIIIFITAILHRIINGWRKDIREERILENLEEITEYEKQKRDLEK